MMKARSIISLLPGGLAAGLAGSLVDAGVKTFVLLTLATLAAAGLHKSAAATRHAIWMLAMVCALAMPLLSLCLPQWRVLPSWLRVQSGSEATASLVSEPRPALAQANTQPAPVSAESERMAFETLSRETVLRGVTTARISRADGFQWSPSLLLVITWAAGASFLLLPLMRSAFVLRRLERRCRFFDDGIVLRSVRESAHELNLGRGVAVHEGPSDAMPMVWGIWRAHLLLPASAGTWPPTRLRAVLLHELAHLRRRDPLALLLAQLARALHWFNPLAWVAVNQLRAEQERACDDCVLRAGVKPSEYATEVLEIATALRSEPATRATALSMANPARIESRLRLIVLEARNRTALARWVVALASVAAVAVALPLAMLRAAEENPEEAPSEAGYLDLDTGQLVEAHPPGDLFLPVGESDLRARAGLNLAARGEIVNGVQTALIAKQTTWRSNETPRFILEVRNLGDAPRPIPVTQELGELDVDGVRYSWPTKVRVRIPTIEPGETPTLVALTLSSDWRNEAGGDLELPVGEHTVRFALANAWSDAVKLQIVPATTASSKDNQSSLPTVKGQALGATRSVVDEFLRSIGDEQLDKMWELTTRENGMDTNIRKLAAFKSIRAKLVLGSKAGAMVVSTQFKDDSGRLRALLFILVQREPAAITPLDSDIETGLATPRTFTSPGGGSIGIANGSWHVKLVPRWLIQDMQEASPEDIERRVEGFSAHPGVRYDVRPEDLVGEWSSGFLVRSHHTFRLDGTGQRESSEGGERVPFRWEIAGDQIKFFADPSDAHSKPPVGGTIVRMTNDLFAVRYKDGNQWGYHRVAKPPDSNDVKGR